MLGCVLCNPIFGYNRQTKMDELKDKAELFTLISIFLISVIALTPAV